MIDHAKENEKLRSQIQFLERELRMAHLNRDLHQELLRNKVEQCRALQEKLSIEVEESLKIYKDERGFKTGDIVRYDCGTTALVRLNSIHAGGWHGTQCMGGTIFVHDNGHSRIMKLADENDLLKWQECAKWRRE